MPKIFSEEDRDLLRQKLLDAGLAMLEKKPYKNISVEEIALEVGIAKGTFYNFYHSKETFFYELMQAIKERNRASLRALPENASISEIADCLINRYLNTKTVYDYFMPEEMKQIVRRLPDGDSANDSADFASELCAHIGGCKGEAHAIVDMCNILGLAGANRAIMDPDGFEKAIRTFCAALAAYIVRGE